MKKLKKHSICLFRGLGRLTIAWWMSAVLIAAGGAEADPIVQPEK
ncbi:MAG: hypothetical protein WBB70_12715 [Desulfobacterales bacterium]|jgi:hypothetical protein